MTEFEIATLAYQQASLALRESALWVAVAQVAASLAIGIGQIAVVWYGIRAMQRAGTQRAYEQDQRHAEAMARLDQQGRALEALIDGQRKQGEALARQGEALAKQGEALTRQGEALTRQGAALEILIERTAAH